MPRTRSASAHQKVLDAALELVAERGVEATSMDAVARQSGVSKATIYKHWKDKDALLLEMMAEVHGIHRRPVFDSGDTRADLVAVMSYRPPENSDVRERILPQFVAYASSNPGFGMAWRKMVMDPSLRELKRLLKQGIKKGEFPRDLNIDLALALLLGPMIYWRVLLKGTTFEMQGLAEDVIDAFWRAFGRKQAPARTT
jgi:AcrR family transcriptional regulator